MNRLESQMVTDRLLGTLRWGIPMVTQELVDKTGFPYHIVYRRLAALEKKNRVIGFRSGHAEQIMWSLNE